jgi:hypothetical protein
MSNLVKNSVREKLLGDLKVNKKFLEEERKLSGLKDMEIKKLRESCHKLTETVHELKKSCKCGSNNVI